MNAIAGIPGIKIILFVVICLAQIAGGAILPKTNGFAALGWTIACVAVYTFSFWLMALIIRLGIPLSSLVPMMSAVIPLSLTAIGVLVFGESASLLRLCLLGGACVLVGLATAYG